VGRSRGGLTTKIHTLVDAQGLPIRFLLSPGQDHDATAADTLLDDLLPDSFLLGDKAYDADWIRAKIEAQDAVPIIPDRSNRKQSHPFSPTLYTLRNRVERLFNKLKQFRRIDRGPSAKILVERKPDLKIMLKLYGGLKNLILVDLEFPSDNGR